jgi:hypothetical protein
MEVLTIHLTAWDEEYQILSLYCWCHSRDTNPEPNEYKSVPTCTVARLRTVLSRLQITDEARTAMAKRFAVFSKGPPATHSTRQSPDVHQV